MRSRQTRELIRKIAEDEDLTVKQVEEIVYSFFRFTSKKMKEGDKYTRTYESIRLFKFGIFSVKRGRINELKRRDERLN
jgi:nucleoid DNA-binding protein